MDKTTNIPLLWTANDDSGEGKAIIIIDDPSPRDTLRSLCIPSLFHRYFYLPASPCCSHRRRGCDCGKTVGIFSPLGPADWTDGKFPNEFIAFNRTVYVHKYRVRYTVIYYISFFQKMIPLHYTLLADATATHCVTPPPKVPKAVTIVTTAAAAITRQYLKRRYEYYAWWVFTTSSWTGSGNRTLALLFFVFMFHRLAH